MGVGGDGAGCLTASAKDLREVAFSFLRSANPFSTAVTTGVRSRGVDGSWVEGRVGVGVGFVGVIFKVLQRLSHTAECIFQWSEDKILV